MSYDFTLWSRKPATVFAAPLLSEGCVEVATDHWEFTARNWMITLHIDPVDDDDIPDEIFGQLRGITHQVAVHVQPINAPKPAHAKAKRLLRALAEAGEGLWQDLQSEALTRSKAARALAATSRATTDRSVTVLQMEWAMTHSHVMTREGVTGLLDLLERYLPEALPRRYGPYEPLRFKYAEQGRDHFIQTYLDDPGTIIYATRPAFSLYLPSFPTGKRIGRYWSACVEISLDGSLLADPDWAAHLPKAFKALSIYLNPYYGQARLAYGFEVSRNGALMMLTRGGTPPPDDAVVSAPLSPWWRGLPQLPALACVIGAPYTDLWEDRTGWHDTDGLSFCQTDQWTRTGVPSAIPAHIATTRPNVEDK